MTLWEKQCEFARILGELLVWIDQQPGMAVTVGDAARMDQQGHKKNSKHYRRLAIDLNLFINGVYQEKSEKHLPLGEKWEALGGTWGGRFKDEFGNPAPDGNHYEL